MMLRRNFKYRMKCRNTGNFLAVSKKLSFILSLPDIVNFLFGHGNKPGVLTLFSADGYTFVDKASGSESLLAG